MSPDKADNLLSHIRVHARFFRIEEESRACWAKFLNLKIFMPTNSKTFLTKYYRKDTNVCLPLPANSGQAPAIHRTWPIQMIKSIDGLCTRSVHAQEAVDSLHDRFSEAIVPVLWPREIPHVYLKVVKRRPAIIWMPLPYHPAIVPTLRHALEATMKELAVSTPLVFGTGKFIDATEIRIAWANFGRPLMIVLRNLSS